MRSGSARLMAAASTLAVPRASVPASASSLTRMALAAPMASAGAQTGGLAVRCHRHQGDLAALAASASCRAISTP